MDDLAIANDTRGWIMCATSGVACVFGASIICVDVLVRMIPSKRNFRIQDSNVFLASSLSLSFGVMLFSALYSMLPSSKKNLTQGGYSSHKAAWTLLACFAGGFIGIQVVSRFLHHHIPSHVVDCDHTHEEVAAHTDMSDRSRSHSKARLASSLNGSATESTPLLPSESNGFSLGGDGAGNSRPSNKQSGSTNAVPTIVEPVLSRRPSMAEVQKRVMSFAMDTKTNCDSTGPCYGYSDPCGNECFKHIPKGSSSRRGTTSSARQGSFVRTYTSQFRQPSEIPEEIHGTERLSEPRREPSLLKMSSAHSSDALDDEPCSSDDEDVEAQHHHHVPENAFMSIGLQTSIAIALHKLPEGFITYATNHANPQLGFSVFMALFIHNITEGFAMALPLYLALNSRAKAMAWASLLGGISQPLGAGIAATWFKIAGNEGHKPGAAVYGCMFAITAGIMTSVALQLFVESLSLHHNQNLCIAFAFIGMAIMGMSNALTA